MKTASGHLTYCTNIHAGETWTDHFEAIRQNIPVIKNSLSPNASMGIGLRLSNIASLALAQTSQLEIFKTWLQENDAYVFTMNGFPYGGFHHTRVKEQVHAPDWTTSDRYEYSLRLFTILSQFLPAGLSGGVSTSPLSYRFWFGSEDEKQMARKLATTNIARLAIELILMHQQRAVLLHLDIEPEPDGLLETGGEFISWYEEELIPIAVPLISQQFHIDVTEAARLLKAHVCLCYDVCHFAIGYENHNEVIAVLASKGIRVGKIQVSAALKASLNDGGSVSRSSVLDAFSGFNESTYLHQVVARGDQGLIRYRDLPEALKDGTNVHATEWRAHFHVPVFTTALGVLQTTQHDITQVLTLNQQQQFTDHIEVETYTWEVLPDALKLPLDASIIRELKWVNDQL